MRRREVITILSGAAAWPLAVRAQQSERVRRIGVLESAGIETDQQAGVAVFKEILSQLGWIDGRNGGRRPDVRNSLCADDAAIRQYASIGRQMATRNRIPTLGDRMNVVHKVTIQVRAPRGHFPGEIAEGWYCIVDGYLVMTDAAGKPVDSEKHTLTPGEDARLKACRLVRRSRSRPRGFGDKINYPRAWRKV